MVQETIRDVLLGAAGSVVAAVLIYLSRQAFLNWVTLRRYSFLSNIPGTWYGLHYTNSGKQRKISLHEYNLRLSGRRIIGTRAERGIIGQTSDEEPATYIVSGKMNNRVLILTEACEETQEIGVTVLTNFAIKNIFRGIYTSSCDFNGIPFSSPIILRKNSEPSGEDLQALAESANWCSWTTGA